MPENLLFFTELLGLPVYDLKGRRLGRVRDSAIVPLVDPFRVDRYLIGAGSAWLTVRHDQIHSISLEGIRLNDEVITTMSTCYGSPATCWISRSSM
jgi:magnesium transporter